MDHFNGAYVAISVTVFITLPCITTKFLGHDFFICFRDMPDNHVVFNAELVGNIVISRVFLENKLMRKPLNYILASDYFYNNFNATSFILRVVT